MLYRFQENPAGTFDVILMDMMMLVMDGITATKTIPIIAMTANVFAAALFGMKIMLL